MRIVVALGGNALAKRGEPMTAQKLRDNIEESAADLAALALGNDLVVTHGNGPQVGLLALQDLAYTSVPPYPLDILVAESQGMIGYPLQTALRNALDGRKGVVTVLTTTRVASDDPGFADPTKFIGPMYDRDEGEEIARRHGWSLKADGNGFRRVVPSPQPIRVLEAPVIRDIIDRGHVAIAVGGGGVPVTSRDGRQVGVEAVVDKDLASAVLAEELGADTLLILTDTDYVVRDWGTPEGRKIRAGTPDSLDMLDFAEGSMGPKVEAAKRFARAGGRALIGPLAHIQCTLQGVLGTEIRGDVAEGIEYAD